MCLYRIYNNLVFELIFLILKILNIFVKNIFKLEFTIKFYHQLIIYNIIEFIKIFLLIYIKKLSMYKKP